MINVQASIEINRTIADVFTFAADFENDTRWRSEVQKMYYTSPRPIKRGDTCVEVSNVLGQKLETTTEITAYDPPNQVAVKTINAVTPVTGGRYFESLPDGGTRITYTLSADVSKVLLFRLARPLLQRWYQATIESYLHTLKTLLESNSAVR